MNFKNRPNDEATDYSSEDNDYLSKQQKIARVGTAGVGAASVAAGLMYDRKEDDNMGQKKGQLIGAGVGGVITAINPVIGAVATPILSWAGGQIGHDSDTQRLSKKRNNMLYKDSMELNMAPNEDSRGDSSSYYYADGGEIPQEQMQDPEMQGQQPQQGQPDPAQLEQMIDSLAQAHGMDPEQFSQMLMQEAEKQGVDPMELLNQMAQQQGQQSGQQPQQMQQMQEDPASQGQPQEQPQPQEPKPVNINIERGELLVDPGSMKIIKTFKNPSVYSPHEKSKFKEPHGNFVDVPEGSVVIPKKLAIRYEKGDALTKSSILKKILDQQAQNPEQNNPDNRNGEMDNPEEGQQFMATGGGVYDDNEFPYLYDKPMTGLNINGIPNRMLDSTFDAPSVSVTAKRLGNGKLKTENQKLGQYQPFITGIRIDAANYIQPYKPNIIGQELPSDYGSNTKTSKTKNPANVGLYASTAANFIPTLWGLANAQKNSEWTKYDENRNYEDYNNSIRNMETRVPVDNVVYQNNKATSSLRRMLGNHIGPENFAMASELQSNNLESRNNLFAAKNNAEVSLRNQQRTLYGQSKLQQGDHRLARRDKYNLEMGQDEAARQNLTHQGLSEFATNQAKFRNDKEKIKTLNSMSDLYDFDPFVKKSIMDDPNSMKFIQSYMKRYDVSFEEAVLDNYGEVAKSKKSKTLKTPKNK